MTEWIETELKLGLPHENAWRWVRSRLGPGPVVEQQNHFFDAPDQTLRKRRIGVRLRLEVLESRRSLRTLTVKSNRDENASQAITRRLELETTLDPEEFDRALREGLHLSKWLPRWHRIEPEMASDRHELARLLDALEAAGPLERYASFSNRRETLAFECIDRLGPLQMDLELDRTEYPGGRIDFEVEVERTSERDGSMLRTHRALTDWLATEGGIRTFTAESKLARLNALLDESHDPPKS